MSSRYNSRGGKNNKRRVKRSHLKDFAPTKQEGQEYAQVCAVYGNCRFLVECFDATRTMLQVVLLNSRKRQFWVTRDDVVLVSPRTFEKGKGDILTKYNRAEIQYLQDHNELPQEIEGHARQVGDPAAIGFIEDGFVFRTRGNEKDDSSSEPALAQPYDPFDLEGLDGNSDEEHGSSEEDINLNEL